MPNIGETKRGYEVGRNCPCLYIWHACIDCGKERWVLVKKGKARTGRCSSCAHKGNFGRESTGWKGGRYKNGAGYIRVYLDKNDFFYPMANRDGYILEHRLVVAKHSNRCLLPWEIVHHRNGIRADNRIENLMLLPSHSYHVVDSVVKHRILRLEKQVEDQSKEIRLLKWQIKELKEATSEVDYSHHW